MMRVFPGIFLALCLFLCVSVTAEHRILLHGGNRLVVVAPDGEIEWEMPWGGIHDIHVLGNGNILVQQGMQKIAEINPNEKKVVWSYDAQASNGNEGKKLEVHAFQPLADDRFMLAESGIGRIIEIDRDGNLLKEIKLKIDKPHPHMDTRLVRKLDNGHYLVCHEGDGFVREYDGEGTVVWEYDVPLFDKEPAGGHGPDAWGDKTFCALRLPNGNTLLSTGNGHGVLEVTPEKEIVWHLKQNDLPDVTFAWVTTLEVLPNGNYIIGNCHAGEGQPILVEVDPKSKELVWKFDRFDDFGNNVSNSIVLSAPEGRIR